MRPCPTAANVHRRPGQTSPCLTPLREPDRVGLRYRERSLMLNDESGNPMDNLSRRRFMSVTMAVAGLAATGALVGCSRTESISTDPNLLTLWYWKRSISEKLLDSARRSITGTPRRLRTDPVSYTHLTLPTKRI